VKEFMENLDEYILRFQQYKEGNYEYNPILDYGIGVHALWC